VISVAKAKKKAAKPKPKKKAAKPKAKKAAKPKKAVKARVKCAAKTKSGKPCRNYAVGRSKYCDLHKKK
jgi:hypothetical protein